LEPVVQSELVALLAWGKGLAGGAVLQQGTGLEPGTVLGQPSVPGWDEVWA
jgi:hypothetical protein